MNHFIMKEEALHSNMSYQLAASVIVENNDKTML